MEIRVSDDGVTGKIQAEGCDEHDVSLAFLVIPEDENGEGWRRRFGEMFEYVGDAQLDLSQEVL